MLFSDHKNKQREDFDIRDHDLNFLAGEKENFYHDKNG